MNGYGVLAKLISLGVIALVAVIAAAKGHDAAYIFHAYVISAVAMGLIVYYSRSFSFAPAGPAPAVESTYFDEVIKAGVIATVFWGVAGFLLGVVIASQLAWPALNLDLPWTTFGRLRPLHTSAVVFAFGGNALIATSFYVVQRTCRARLAFGNLAWFVFWGYQLFIVLAATGYLLGVTASREYAEPEWYVDIWLTLVWVAYFLVFFGTLLKRKEPHIYVANWFYLAFIVTIAMLHIVNNLAVPVSFLGSKSYSLFSGVQDALIQWWYGHNAVGFFLTAGFLGMMYYFVPKRVGRPVYSYRLSIVHFWSLIFLYIWAGPHHLHYTALAGLGANPRHGVFGHAVDALLGRHDQRPDDAVWRLGQAAHGSGAAHDGAVGRLLRHVHLRRADDVDQVGQFTEPLYGLDHWPRAFRRAWLGGHDQHGRGLRPGAQAVEKGRPLQQPAGELASLARNPRHRTLCLGHVGVGHHAGPDVARI